jgi:hypothetical protein
MALNQHQATMLTHSMAALQGAAPGGYLGGIRDGVPPPGPPLHPQVQSLQAPSADAGFVSNAFWEIRPRDPRSIAQEIESYNAATKQLVISGRSHLAAFLSTRLGESRPLMVHSLGTYGDTVARSLVRGQFFGLTGDTYLDPPPTILWQ